MPFVLRQIRKAKWYRHSNVLWLVEGELQADALADLKTSNNTLSVWLIHDDGSNLEQVVTALAATRQNTANLDYALLDLAWVSQLDIRSNPVAGDTPDPGVNGWHLDLVELSAKKLLRLAETILEQATIERISEKALVRLIREAVNSGRIDPAKLSPRVAAKTS